MALVSYGDGGVVCVDRFEAATVLVAADGGTSPHPYDQPVDVVPNGLTIAAVVADGIKPQGYISEVQARPPALHAGKRLCTLPEWLGACQGPSGFTYPYGNTYMAGACNEGRATNPVNDCFGPGGGVFTGEHELIVLRRSAQHGGARRQPSPSACRRSASTICTATCTSGSTHDGVDAATASSRAASSSTPSINGAGCLYATTAHAQSYHDYSTGFRCCADPR